MQFFNICIKSNLSIFSFYVSYYWYRVRTPHLSLKLEDFLLFFSKSFIHHVLHLSPFTFKGNLLKLLEGRDVLASYLGFSDIIPAGVQGTSYKAAPHTWLHGWRWVTAFTLIFDQIRAVIAQTCSLLLVCPFLSDGQREQTFVGLLFLFDC